MEKCGVAGITGIENCAKDIYHCLHALQHRGQESAGIAVCDTEINHSRGMGLVRDAFTEEDLMELEGDTGIGHVRYSTTGTSSEENAQPLIVNHAGGRISVAHNGDVLNTSSLKGELEERGHVFITESDTEVIAHMLAKELTRREPFGAIENVMRRLKGSYSLTLLIDGELYAVRDPLGIKPLCYGQVDDGYVVASESCALDAVGAGVVRDVEPGEIVSFRDGVESHRPFDEQAAHCFFEYIYFARPDSLIDGRRVYDARLSAGSMLAGESGVDADLVSPVPDSGITFAIGYSRESGIEYGEALLKNRYVGRTFIMPKQLLREKGVSVKMNVLRGNVEGKRVVLVDDSIVRGTTSSRLIEMLRDAGAEEVHFRIGCPPIKAPCYYGIDMATREELIASDRSVEDVRRDIGADSLSYLSIDGMIEATGLSRDELCLGCLTVEYPHEEARDV